MWNLPWLILSVEEEEEEEEWSPSVEEWAPAVLTVVVAPMVLAWDGVGRAHVRADPPVWEAFTEAHSSQDTVEIFPPLSPAGTIGIAMETMGHSKPLRNSNNRRNNKIQTSS